MKTKCTKGEWEVKYVGNICIGVGTKPINGMCQIISNTVLPDTNEEYLKEKEEIEANAKLFASSKDLLNSLCEAQIALSLAINAIPTGKLRNKLTEVNIKSLQTITNIKQ